MSQCLHTVLAFPFYSYTNIALLSVKQVLADVKYRHPAWFGLLHPHLLLDMKGLLAALGGVQGTKAPATEPLYRELI